MRKLPNNLLDRWQAMELIKDSIETAFSPLGILTIIMLAGLVLSCCRSHVHLGRRLLFCSSILFLIFLFSPLAKYLVLPLESQYPPLISPESNKARDIVMLAGYAEENPGFPVTSNISDQTVLVLSEGLRLSRLIPGARLITSGGIAREGDKPVAAIMADFLQQMGVPDQDLVVEGNSHNTYENFVELKKIVGSRPFILVTLGCDMKRAAAVARKLHMQAIPAPAGLWALQHHRENRSFFKQIGDFSLSFAHPSPANLLKLQWAYHEYLGLLWYRLSGRI
jgi:uncharacterized SAM-binding protein YcdF (DUF218 family)